MAAIIREAKRPVRSNVEQAGHRHLPNSRRNSAAAQFCYGYVFNWHNGSNVDLGLNKHTALVTGSHRGTGQIIAQQLLQEGTTVLVHGLHPGEAEAAVEAIGGGIPVTGDITNDSGADSVAEQCSGFPVDILVNNYGTADPGSWQASTADDWIVDYQKNVLSAQRMIRHFMPAMEQQGWGRIINLGTVGSSRPNARMPGYYAAKGALANMTVGLAKAVAGTGIRVNLVSPGLILTPEVEAAYLAKGEREGWGRTWAEVEPHVARDIPIRRIARREEVAALVAFLCSHLADAIHGQNIRIDGGAVDIVT
jgi:NAD(P)-dependent dehydrogenase (short-subunit alcohol dehydrogenase family)